MYDTQGAIEIMISMSRVFLDFLEECWLGIQCIGRCLTLFGDLVASKLVLVVLAFGLLANFMMVQLTDYFSFIFDQVAQSP